MDLWFTRDDRSSCFREGGVVAEFKARVEREQCVATFLVADVAVHRGRVSRRDGKRGVAVLPAKPRARRKSIVDVVGRAALEFADQAG